MTTNPLDTILETDLPAFFTIASPVSFTTFSIASGVVLRPSFAITAPSTVLNALLTFLAASAAILVAVLAALESLMALKILDGAFLIESTAEYTP